MKTEYSELATQMIEMGEYEPTINEIVDWVHNKTGFFPRMSIDNLMSNGLAKLSLRDRQGKIICEWHDSLSVTCDICGEAMDKYANNGYEYDRCPECLSKTQHVETAFDFGRNYAEWSIQDGYDGGPIDYEKSYPEIPDGDYARMVDLGIVTDARSYWMGFNSFFEEEN